MQSVPRHTLCTPSPELLNGSGRTLFINPSLCNAVDGEIHLLTNDDTTRRVVLGL